MSGPADPKMFKRYTLGGKTLFFPFHNSMKREEKRKKIFTSKKNIIKAILLNVILRTIETNHSDAVAVLYLIVALQGWGRIYQGGTWCEYLLPPHPFGKIRK